MFSPQVSGTYRLAMTGINYRSELGGETKNIKVNADSFDTPFVSVQVQRGTVATSTVLGASIDAFTATPPMVAN